MAINTWVTTGGSITINKGTLGGGTEVCGTITVNGSAYADTICFRQDYWTTSKQHIFVNNISSLHASSYRLAITAAQSTTTGNYLLATGSQNFNQSISVWVDNSYVGFVSLNKSYAQKGSGLIYGLTENNGNLYFSVNQLDTTITDLSFDSELVLTDNATGEQPKFYYYGDTMALSFSISNLSAQANNVSYKISVDGKEYYTSFVNIAEYSNKGIKHTVELEDIQSWLSDVYGEDMVGSHTISVTLDYANKINESNETNNISEVTFQYESLEDIPDQALELIARNSWNGSCYTRDSVYQDYVKGDVLTATYDGKQYYFLVDEVFQDKATGFYSLGLVRCTHDGEAYDKGQAVLVCRGTQGDKLESSNLQDKWQGILDWYANSNPVGIGVSQYNSVAGGKVLQWLQNKNDNKFSLNITGQSLGGALAQMFAATSPVMVNNLVTFNSPGVNKIFGDSAISRIRHYIMSGDLVSTPVWTPATRVVSSVTTRK